MIDFKEVVDGDNWELFARDFFVRLGFVIESEPSRGADGGKDIIISEQLSGNLHSKKFTWLVSCKHFAKSGKAVGVEHETNIIERLKQHACDGFIGFYSTMPSSALVARLEAIKKSRDIEDFLIYDYQKIAGYFYDSGLSSLAIRYFPQSYIKLRPLQRIAPEHVKLTCEICEADWMKEIITRRGMGIVVYAAKEVSGERYTEDVFICCKGMCDKTLTDRLRRQGYTDLWQDIEDLCNPLLFLKDIMTYMNMLRDGKKNFSDKAHEKIKIIYIAAAQRVLREVTEEDREKYADDFLFS